MESSSSSRGKPDLTRVSQGNPNSGHGHRVPGSNRPPLAQVFSLHRCFLTSLLLRFPLNLAPPHGVWQVYTVRGPSFASPPRRRHWMQELILIEPGSTANAEWMREAERTAIRREFEERLADSAALAYRVA